MPNKTVENKEVKEDVKKTPSTHKNLHNAFESLVTVIKEKTKAKADKHE